MFLLLQRVRLRTREKLFIAWGGLKGAVPILLAAIALVSGAEDSLAIYNIVFVVVLVSVLVQGSTIPYRGAAARDPDPDRRAGAVRGLDRAP